MFVKFINVYLELIYPYSFTSYREDDWGENGGIMGRENVGEV
jgi:hypothetical protein